MRIYLILIIIISIGIFIVPRELSAQTMKAKDILNNLKIYQDLLNEIAQKETEYLKKKGNITTFTKNIRSAYSFIRLELRNNDTENLYCEIEFEIKNDLEFTKKVYCEDQSRVAEIEKLVNESKLIHNKPWNTKTNSSVYINKTITDYLDMADEIALPAYNYTSGDNYRPGLFSEIIIDDVSIKLRQINFMNSKSTAHKDNYSLRKLEFVLPLTKSVEQKTFHDYKIGEMMIYFSDSSSKNNRSCGEAIVEKIKEATYAFDKK